MAPANIPVTLIVAALSLTAVCWLFFARTKRKQVRLFVSIYYIVVVAGFALGALLGGELWFAPVAILTFPWSWLIPYFTASQYPPWFYKAFLASLVVSVGIGTPANAMCMMFLSRFAKDS